MTPPCGASLPDAWRFVSVLAGNIGERPTGSDNNLLAQNYIEHQLVQAGCTVRLLGFEIPSWIADRARCSCAGRDVPVVPNPYSPSCLVSAPSVAVGTVAGLAAADLFGKVAVLHGELTAEPLMPRNFPFYAHAIHQEIARLIEEKAPRAVITVAPRDDQAVPVIIDGDFPVPSCTVTSGAGGYLLSHAGCPVTLTLDTRTGPARVADVIGGLPGSEQRKIVICAHFDTKYGTPGALDNASGVGVLLALARAFKDRPLIHALELLFVNGEECYAAPGEVAYLRGGGCDKERVAMCVNLDGIGLSGACPSISYYGCPGEMESACDTARADDPGMVRVDPWPQGDHTMFVMAGIPSIAFSTGAAPEVIHAVIHTKKDRLECLDRDLLGRTARTVERVVRAADLVLGTSR